jgi:probable F420-dependent oxidoreductase
MDIGYFTMNGLHNARPDDLARALEERGFESLWVGDHPQIPVSRKTPYPAGGEMPEHYKYLADPFVSLSMAAAATKNLRLGFAVALLLERDVFSTAKAIATLDRLSGGRLLLGVGVGWNQEEFENATSKVPWNKRYSGLKDCSMAMRALWTQDEASYQGTYYQFEKVWSYPKPLQQPWPPIYLGVAGKIGSGHAAEWGDGWFPMDVGTNNFESKLKHFRASLQSLGRDSTKVNVSVLAFYGDMTADKLKQYRDMGVDRVVISGVHGNESAPLPYMDRIASMIAELK